MSFSFRTLGKHTLIYAGGIAISKLAGFLMLPIYTRFLTPSDYGVLELLSMTIEVIGTIASLGLAMGVFKFHAEQSDEAGKNRVISTSEIALVALAGVTALGGVLAASQLSGTILGDEGRPLYFQLFFLIYFFQTAENVPLLYLRAENRSGLFVTASVSKLVLMLALNIWFVVFLDMGVTGVLTGNLIANGVISSVLTAYVLRRVGIGFSVPLAREMASFGAPLIVFNLANFVLVFSDRYFLQHFFGTSEVGIYSLAYRFAGVLTAFGFRPFLLIWGPERFKVARDHDEGSDIFPRVFRYMNIALGMVGLLIVVLADETIRVMADPAFHSAYRVVPLLVAGQILYHWVPFSNLGLYVKERSGLLGGLGTLSAGCVVVLNIAMIPRFGVVGAAGATLLAYGFRYAVILVASRRYLAIGHGWIEIGVLYLILLSAACIHEALRGDATIVVSTALSGLIFLGAAVGVYRLVLGEAERSEVLAIARRSFVALRRICRREALVE